MAPGKINCKLTGSPSLNKVFELKQLLTKKNALNTFTQ